MSSDSSWLDYVQGYVPLQCLPPLPEDGDTTETEVLLADHKADDVSLASAHTPIEEAEDSEQEEEDEVPLLKRRRADDTKSTAESSPPRATRGEDSDSSSTDSGELKEKSPSRAASPVRSPSFKACIDYNTLILSDDDEPQ